MARLQLNKSSLARETANLEAYERFLPSLDLKRRQLMAQRAAAARALAATQEEIEAVVRGIGARAPMLANTDIALDDLVAVEGADYGVQNIVGVKLPTFKGARVSVRPYSRLAKPHWVDLVVEKLREALTLHLRKEVEARRLELLEEAVKTVTQRVNLFEKVLIPRTRKNIKRIRIYLSDEQVSAVVRSKLAKRKHAGAAVTIDVAPPAPEPGAGDGAA